MWTRYRILWDAMEGQRLRYVLAIALMIAGTQIAYLVPLVVRGTIDSVIGEAPLDAPARVAAAFEAMGGRDALRQALWMPGAIMVGLTVLAGLCGYSRGRLVAIASETTARRLRDRLYDHLQRLPVSYHDKADMGDLVQRCTSDVETVRGFLAGQIVEIGRAIVMVLMVLPIMLALDLRMTLVAMAVVPPVVLFSFIFFWRVKAAFQLADEAEGALTTRLQENLTGIRVVRAFARQEHECERFGRCNARLRDLNRRMIWLMSWYWSSSDLLCITQGALVVLGGAYWISQGRMTVGTLVAFIAYVNMFLWPVRQMGRILTEVGRTMVSLGRLDDILAVKHEADPPRPPALPADAVRGGIEVAGLTFSHGGAAHALTDVSFRIGAGQTLALLGPSGSGKSTFVHLLLRLYEYQAGSIRLDGRELRDLARRDVRARIGVVMQEPFLYSKSVRDNIRLGGTQAGEDDIRRAATLACIHDNIMEFEKGYDTMVGERGVTLSGGQRQRLALARAILADPPILILDDALSAVDTETETMILEALRSRRGRRTTIVIAHRLSTLMAADRIIVLEGGRVTQSGTHDQLRRQEGLYRRLWEIQGAMQETV